MKRRRRQSGMGRLFQRRSRLTGKLLPCWWMGYYMPGEKHERQEATGTENYHEALTMLRKRQGEIAAGKMKPGAAERKSVNDILALLRKHYEDTDRTPPQGYLEAFGYELGRFRALDVNREMLDDLRRKWKREGVQWPERKTTRVRPISGGTCNRYLAILGLGYNLAKEKWGLVTGLTFPKERETARGEYMPPATFIAVRNQLPTQDMRDVFELAYLTSKRKGQWRQTELANVVRKCVGGVERLEIHWRGDQTKSGKRDGQPDILPLAPRALAIVQGVLARRREGETCPFLFHSAKCGHWTRRHRAGEPCLGRMQSEWERACSAAGVPCGRKQGGFVFHNARHSAVTNMSGAGTPDSVATTITGHRSLAVYKRYGIRQASVQLAAMEKVEEYVRGLSGSEPTPALGRKAS